MLSCFTDLLGMAKSFEGLSSRVLKNVLMIFVRVRFLQYNIKSLYSDIVVVKPFKYCSIE